MNERHLLDIIRAGLNGDKVLLEHAALAFSRSLKKELPATSEKIIALLGDHSFFGGNSLRADGVKAPPTNPDSSLDMAIIVAPDESRYPRPKLNEYLSLSIDNFLEERANIATLLRNGIMPSNKILLTGAPGTGKTMLARYLASALGKNLVIMDISSSISSLLGKTGANIKKILNYAKSTSSVLLLDEFDAIAKRRDDNTDLGELKRVVNVLLMEMEEWPSSSLLIATSNHPELLDRAIWRRFDFHMDIGLPDVLGIRDILFDLLSEQMRNDADRTFLGDVAGLLDGVSAADVCRFTNSVKRRMILKKEIFLCALIYELGPMNLTKKNKGLLCVIAKDSFVDLTVRQLADLTGLSSSGVQHHLSKLKN